MLHFSGIYGLDNGKWLKKLNEDFKHIAPLSLLYENTCSLGTRDEITRKIRDFYLSDKNIDESNRFKVIDVSIHRQHSAINSIFIVFIIK